MSFFIKNFPIFDQKSQFFKHFFNKNAFSYQKFACGAILTKIRLFHQFFSQKCKILSDFYKKNTFLAPKICLRRKNCIRGDPYDLVGEGCGPPPYLKPGYATALGSVSYLLAIFALYHNFSYFLIEKIFFKKIF